MALPEDLRHLWPDDDLATQVGGELGFRPPARAQAPNVSARADRPGLDDLKRVEVTSVEELHTWLQANHGQHDSVWLVTHKKVAGPTYVSRDEVLDELLCFGWIDGARRKLDDRRTMQLVGPRRTNRWARSYQERAARLQADGRLRPAGLAAIERSKAAGLWDAMAEVDALVWPPDLESALRQRPGAAEFFRDSAPSYQRNVLRWIELAKTDKTRVTRIDRVAELSAATQRIRYL